MMMVDSELPFLLKPSTTTLECHLQPGDSAHINRQPTLHSGSLQYRRIRRIDYKSRTIKLSDSSFANYNADCDGDEVNMHVPQSILARAECLILMHPTKTFLDDATGRVMYGMVQMRILGAEQLSHSETLLTKDQMLRYLALADMKTTNNWFCPPGPEYSPYHQHLVLPPPAIQLPVQRWTGRQLIAMVTPWCFRTDYQSKVVDVKKKDKIITRYRFLMRNGHFLVGLLTKEHVGVGKHPLTQQIHQLWGPKHAMEWIHNFGQIAVTFAYESGWTIRAKDFQVPKVVLDEIKTTMEHHVKIAETKVRHLHKKQLETQYFTTDLRPKDAEFVLVDERRGRDKCGAILNKSMQQQCFKNQLVLGIKSGARGSEFCTNQMLAAMGQQQIDNLFPEPGFRERAFTTVPRRAPALDNKGNISVGIAQGLLPKEAFAQAQAGRDGTIKTNMGTSISGTANRQLVSGLQSAILRQNRAVYGNKNHIVQWVYGQDGLHCQRMCWISLPYLWKDQTGYLVREMCGAPQEWIDAVCHDQLLLQQYQMYSGVTQLEHVFSAAFDPLLYLHMAKSDPSTSSSSSSSSEMMMMMTAEMLWMSIQENILLLRDIAGVPVSTFITECALRYHLRPQNALPVTKKAVDQMWVWLLRQYARSLAHSDTSVGYLGAVSISEDGTQKTQNLAKESGKECMHMNEVNSIMQVIHDNTSDNNIAYIESPLVDPLGTNYETVATLARLMPKRTIQDVAKKIEIRAVAPPPSSSLSLEGKAHMSRFAGPDLSCVCVDDDADEVTFCKQFEMIAWPLSRRVMCWQHVNTTKRGRKKSVCSNTTTVVSSNSNRSSSAGFFNYNGDNNNNKTSQNTFLGFRNSSSFGTPLVSNNNDCDNDDGIRAPPESQFILEDDVGDDDDEEGDDDDDDGGNGTSEMETSLYHNRDGAHSSMKEELGPDSLLLSDIDDDDDDKDRKGFDLCKTKTKRRQGSWSPFVICIELDIAKCVAIRHSPGSLASIVLETFGCDVHCAYSSASNRRWFLRCRIFVDGKYPPPLLPSARSQQFEEKARREAEPTFQLTCALLDHVTNKMIISGISGIDNVDICDRCRVAPVSSSSSSKTSKTECELRKEWRLVIFQADPAIIGQLWYCRQTDWYISDPPSIFPSYGIIGFRRFVECELQKLHHSTGIFPCHIQLVAAQMTSSGRIYPYTKTGIAQMLVTALNVASYEDSNTVLCHAAAGGATEPLSGGFDSLFVAAPMNYGTDTVRLLSNSTFDYRTESPICPIIKTYRGQSPRDPCNGFGKQQQQKQPSSPCNNKNDGNSPLSSSTTMMASRPQENNNNALAVLLGYDNADDVRLLPCRFNDMQMPMSPRFAPSSPRYQNDEINDEYDPYHPSI